MSNQTTYKHRPLTKKARAAIEQYVHVQSEKKGRYLHVAVESVLKADRMNRDDLYSYLERRGYRWKQNTWRLM